MMTPEDTKVHDDLWRIVSQVAFPPWSIIVCSDAKEHYLQVRDPNGKCNVTGAPRPWSGRKWRLSRHMTETEVVKTALKAVLAACEHEALERFTYRGQTIFDPHLSVETLFMARVSFPLDARE